MVTRIQFSFSFSTRNGGHPLLISANAIGPSRSLPSRDGERGKRFLHVHAFIIVWCTVYAKWEYHGIDIHITRDRDLVCFLPSSSFV